MTPTVLREAGGDDYRILTARRRDTPEASKAGITEKTGYATSKLYGRMRFLPHSPAP